MEAGQGSCVLAWSAGCLIDVLLSSSTTRCKRLQLLDQPAFCSSHPQAMPRPSHVHVSLRRSHTNCCTLTEDTPTCASAVLLLARVLPAAAATRQPIAPHHCGRAPIADVSEEEFVADLIAFLSHRRGRYIDRCACVWWQGGVWVRQHLHLWRGGRV